MKFIKLVWPLFVVQFFTWQGLFALWIYTTPVVTGYIFNSSQSKVLNYQNGIRWVGFCFAFYSLLAGFLGFMVPKWTKRIGLYPYHGYSLILGSLGLFLMGILSTPIPFLLSFAFIGIAWGSTGNVPYTIIGNIDPKLIPEKDLPKIYILFNFSIIIPQVVAAFLLGYLTENIFQKNPKITLLFGGGSMFIGGIIMLLVKRLGEFSKSIRDSV